MSTARRLLVRVLLAVLVLGVGTVTAFAQGGATSSLSGTVTDTSGAVVPGASVVVKRADTGLTSEAITNAEGQFTVPSLLAGTYSVTVSLSGFKTSTTNDVVINAGVPAGVKITLEVGGVEEQVVVQAGSEVVKTQSTTVATTMTSKQISSLPLTSRSALDFVVNLPGVNTPGTARQSTVNGLPQGAINITMDGVSIQDNFLKTSDGFFARVSPRLDAIEEVTVTSAGNEADSAGQGAVNIRFVTKAGTNTYKGGMFWNYQSDKLNANTFFNNRNLAPDPVTGKAPKGQLKLNQPGFNVGGPISIPGLYNGHDKAFFFFNYEESRSPSLITRSRTILSAGANQGLFPYSTSAGTQTVDLLALAAKNGVNTPLDPIMAKLLADIRTASASGSIVNGSDPLLQTATFQVPSNNYTPFPLGRVDYNVTKNHRLTGSFNYNHINSTPDTTNSREPFFPNFPDTGSQQSTRYTTSEFFRSNLGANLVNEAHFGASGGATQFSPELSPKLFGGNTFGDQGGYFLNFGNGCCGSGNSALTNGGGSGAFSAREAATLVYEDQLNWLRGKHAFAFGGGLTQARVWLQNQQVVPEMRFGLITGDPALSFITAANLPGASAAQVTNAQALYAMLTGRITSINTNARLDENSNQYTYLGNGFQRGKINQWGFFAQDNWRVKNNLTINGGLRYELALPFYATNNSYSTATLADICGISGMTGSQCNVFKPGTLTGIHPVYVNYGKGVDAFHTDKNNIAPSLGLTYRPNFDKGLIKKLAGEEGDTVLFASYAMAYERQDMNNYTTPFGNNPGVSISTTRSQTLGNLTNDGGGIPLLLSQTSRLGPPPFPLTQQYPLVPQLTDTIDIFNPDIQTPYAQTWTGGIRRKVTRDVGVEVRYVGTRHLQGWGAFNINESTVVENGFINEFKNAQANLQANLASGRGSSFAYFGPGTGTVPLPIYLAYFSGINAAGAADPANYTKSTLWGNTNFTTPLAIYNPNPFTPAGTNANTGLEGDPTRRANAIAAGLPVNFFRANPDVGTANVESNSGYTKYDSLQIDLTKRMSHGFLAQANYVYGNAYASSRYSLRTPRKETLQTSSPGGITHAFKANWVYELPFGNGHTFFNDSKGWVDRAINGWEFDGVVRVQSGQMVDLGNVRLVGMTVNDLKKAYGQYEYATTGINPSAVSNIYNLPKDILENTVRAFSTSVTSVSGYGSLGAPTGRYIAPASGPDCLETVPNGYGDCGLRTVVLTGPMYQRWDLSAVKRTRVVGHTMFEFRADMINAFNHPNFLPVGLPTTATNPDNYRVTSLYENGNRTIQLVFRFTW
jgi:hypothetical protein